jgi:hypothetical protein
LSDATYQPKIQRRSDGDELGVAAGGKIDLEDATSEFGFVGEDFTSQQMRGIARNANGSLTVTNLSTGSTVLSDLGGSSPPVLPSTYHVINLSCTGTMTNGSARLPSAESGKFLMIRWTPTAGGSTASLIIYCSGNAGGIAGARVIGSTGSDCSSISLRQSAASFAKLLLFGEADGVWSVLAASGQVTERMA